MKTQSVRLRKKHPVLSVILKIFATFLVFVLLLEIGVFALHIKKPYSPSYQKVDISSIVLKTELSPHDYELLFDQTGLSKIGVDSLLKSGRKDDILSIQEQYFKNHSTSNIQFSPLTCCHEMEYEAQIALLEVGDIIISPTSHFSFFEMGHSAIVVDAEQGRVINATGYNNKSCYENISAIVVDPSFVILRPKAGSEIAKKAAKYAETELLDLHYSISIGVLGSKFQQKPISTHCSHLVWQSYKKFGVDLDYNGGGVVLPMDIAKSDELEIVQIFGIDPKSLK